MDKTTSAKSQDADELIRWQFRMHNRLITCGVAKMENDSYGVITLPHWDLDRGVVETFPSQISAVQRHAVIAERLRKVGWSIASYTR